MRLRRVLTGALGLVMLVGGGAAAAPGAAQVRVAALSRPEVAATSDTNWLARPSAVRAARQLATEGVPQGTILVGSPVPVQLKSGFTSTQAVLDVEGDGDDELLQVRGTYAKPQIVIADGATGTPVWSVLMPTYQFLLMDVPAADGGTDLLVFTGAGGGIKVDARSGRTGVLRWTKTITGDAIGLFGITSGSGGSDLLFGSWTFPQIQLIQLDVSFVSLATGSTRATASVTGEGDYPSAAPAGDLDADGKGDAFLLQPVYGFGGESGGMIRAFSGATERWSAAFVKPATDFTSIIDGRDVTGDGTRDVVLFSEFLGTDGATPTDNFISVVDGKGGTLSGLQPAMSMRLGLFVDDAIAPGDVNADGGQDLIFSGALWYSDGHGAVAFEAVGRNGRIWFSAPSIASSYEGFLWGWWSTAGDMDADGVQDAMVLLGTVDTGVDAVVAVSQKGGGQIFRRDGTAGAFGIPLAADIDGVAGDDVLIGVSGDHPTPGSTRIGFTAANGRTLAPRWTREVLLDAGTGFVVNAYGGHLDGSTPRNDLVVESTMTGSAPRHHAECLTGPDGTVRWTA